MKPGCRSKSLVGEGDGLGGEDLKIAVGAALVAIRRELQ
jgi:hypothetical protein